MPPPKSLSAWRLSFFLIVFFCVGRGTTKGNFLGQWLCILEYVLLDPRSWQHVQELLCGWHRQRIHPPPSSLALAETLGDPYICGLPLPRIPLSRELQPDAGQTVSVQPIAERTPRARLTRLLNGHTKIMLGLK